VSATDGINAVATKIQEAIGATAVINDAPDTNVIIVTDTTNTAQVDAIFNPNATNSTADITVITQ